MGKKIQQQGFAYWIPAKLVEAGDHLKALLYGLVYSLTDEKNNCWASNEYLAEKLGRKDKSIISVKLKELEKDAWISIENALGKNRKIHLTIGNFQGIPLEKTNAQPLEKTNESNTVLSNVTEYESALKFFDDQELQKKTLDWLITKGVEKNLAEQEIIKFIRWWTEPSRTGKLRWQGEKYFDVRRRFITWFSRIKSFNSTTRTRKVWTTQ